MRTRRLESSPSLWGSILFSRSFEDALPRSLVRRLGHPSFPAEDLKRLLLEVLYIDGSIGKRRAPIYQQSSSATLHRPATCSRSCSSRACCNPPHRLAHWLWNAGKRDIALYLQSRSAEIFQTDIHPGARIGKGVFIDHATGFVAGETVVIEDDVSILHGVTLGGTGTEKTDRHPKIRTGVLIGAGAQVIGNIEIGAYSKIAAGSYVTQPVPPRFRPLASQRASSKEQGPTTRPKPWMKPSRKEPTSFSPTLFDFVFRRRRLPALNPSEVKVG